MRKSSWRTTLVKGSTSAIGVAVLGGSLLAAIPSLSGAADDLSEAAARTLESKISLLADPESREPVSYQPIVVTEREANSYFKFRGSEFLPPALHNPQISIAPEKLTARALVNFDELGEFGAKTDDWGAKFLALVFKGQQEVVATGKLETSKGQGTVTLDSMTVGDTSIPPAFVNFLVRNYLERKYKIDLSKPFDLPPHVTRIEVGSGRATFYRGPGK